MQLDFELFHYLQADRFTLTIRLAKVVCHTLTLKVMFEF